MDNNPPPPSNTPDAPDKEKMDQVSLYVLHGRARWLTCLTTQIRRRRLEKLSGPSTVTPKSEQSDIGAPSAQSSASSAAVVQVEAPVKPKINATKGPTPSPVSSDNPFNKLTARATNGSSNSAVSTQPTDNCLKRRAEADCQTTPRQTTRKVPASTHDEPIEEYENRKHSHNILHNQQQIQLCMSGSEF